MCIYNRKQGREKGNNDQINIIKFGEIKKTH